MRILVVEDEHSIAAFIKEGLEEEGYAVDVAHSGTTGMEHAGSNEYDLLILDWMLPGLSGVEICRRVRRDGITTPVIFLTARDTVEDTVFALETGANDFIKKPFDFAELTARVRVQLRPKSAEGGEIVYGRLALDHDTRMARWDSTPIVLTQREFALLEYLMRNREKVCSRTKIIEHVWDIHYDSDTSIIDVYVNYLRNKLADAGAPRLIHTMHGVGYILRMDA